MGYLTYLLYVYTYLGNNNNLKNTIFVGGDNLWFMIWAKWVYSLEITTEEKQSFKIYFIKIVISASGHP